MFQSRAGLESDYNLIASTYLKGARFGNDYFKAIDSDLFYKYYGNFVENRIRTASIFVVCLADEPDTVVGYVVHRQGVVDWIYVKTAFRGQGLANHMLSSIKDITAATGYSKAGAAIAKKKQIAINPWL